MAKEVMHSLIDRIEEYMSVNTFRSIEIVLVIGDHLYLDLSYIKSLYTMFVERFGDKLAHDDSRFVFSAALYQHYDALYSYAKELKSINDKRIPLQINAVLDPLNIQRRASLWNEQLKFIDDCYNKLGFPIEVSMNLSVLAANAMSPREYYIVAKDFNLPEIIVNWTPSINNMAYTYSDLKIIENWIQEFTELLLNDDDLTSDYIEALLSRRDSLLGLDTIEGLNQQIKPLVKNYLYIDSDGNILPRFDAVGDLPHHKTFGYNPSYNIREHSLEEAVDGIYREVARSMLKSTTLDSCQSCIHKSFCTLSGYHVYTDLLRHSSKFDILKNSPLHKDRCPHIGKVVFDTVFKEKDDKH